MFQLQQGGKCFKGKCKPACRGLTKGKSGPLCQARAFLISLGSPDGSQRNTRSLEGRGCNPLYLLPVHRMLPTTWAMGVSPFNLARFLSCPVALQLRLFSSAPYRNQVP